MGREPARLSKLRPSFAGAAQDTAAKDKAKASDCFILNHQSRDSILEMIGVMGGCRIDTLAMYEGLPK